MLTLLTLGLFSPRFGTPGNNDFPSDLDSAKTNNNAPTSARFLNRNCMSHKILYAIVYKKYINIQKIKNILILISNSIGPNNKKL